MTSNPPLREYVFKVIVLGDRAVGKTSMVLQFTERKFQENYIMSIGANFAIKIVNYPDCKVRLQLWDLAGQKHFKFIRPSFYRGAFAAIFVFDISRRESYENIASWVDEATQNAPGIPLFLVGNKIDLIEDRVVSKKEGIELAKKLGVVEYWETSAKSATNIDDLFNNITDLLRLKNIKKLE